MAVTPLPITAKFVVKSVADSTSDRRPSLTHPRELDHEYSGEDSDCGEVPRLPMGRRVTQSSVVLAGGWCVLGRAVASSVVPLPHRLVVWCSGGQPETCMATLWLASSMLSPNPETHPPDRIFHVHPPSFVDPVCCPTKFPWIRTELLEFKGLPFFGGKRETGSKRAQLQPGWDG